MDCVNHPGVNAAAYCQNCGKAMCAECARREPGGQVLCQPCWTAWQSVRSSYMEPPLGGPNPAVAALLGFIPGVGAMYNGQFVKGFIHVAIFAALVTVAGHFGVFGLFIVAWVLYQVFEAYYTAKARRDGDPLPDPLGLNELAGWMHTGGQAEFHPGREAAGPMPAAAQGQRAETGQGPGQDAGRNAGQGLGPGPNPGAARPAGGFAPGWGYAPGYTQPVAGAGYPMHPVPPLHWRRREPVAAIVLIALGVLFLFGQWGWFSDRLFDFAWPVMLIGLGAWLMVRRIGEAPPPGIAPGAARPGVRPAEAATAAGNGDRAQDETASETGPHGGSL